MSGMPENELFMSCLGSSSEVRVSWPASFDVTIYHITTDTNVLAASLSMIAYKLSFRKSASRSPIIIECPHCTKSHRLCDHRNLPFTVLTTASPSSRPTSTMTKRTKKVGVTG